MQSKYQSLYVNMSDKRNLRPSNSHRLLANFIFTSLSIFVLFMALGKIYLDRQIKKMVREWQAKNEQLEVFRKESENLILEQEKYMRGDHILAQAEKLNLRPPEPGQVRIIMSKQYQSKYKLIKKSQNSLVAAK